MELDKMKNSFVTDEELNSAKAKYTGNFVLSLENPSTIAGFARNIITQKLPEDYYNCLLYTSPSPRDATLSRMPSSA